MTRAAMTRAVLTNAARNAGRIVDFVCRICYYAIRKGKEVELGKECQKSNALCAGRTA